MRERRPLDQRLAWDLIAAGDAVKLEAQSEGRKGIRG